ncbi:serpentine type 7TM GPCR chemoreceptor str domain-containing protein [Ditylenchus destructor]|uniref:Serpentine type 7TM GPCR chemoreceptor str domain-containing protein n=1 Tax=Ditylenchus destructor TaxID=166010 RepID=A0AAD4QXG1_9BILA|nr:serpentine type 7TM GPCR chemoreceptor str domain-containing protein [Ditylenchus destructor]
MTVCAQHYSYLYRLVVIKFAEDDGITRKLNNPMGRLLGLLVMFFVAGVITYGAFSISMDPQEIPQHGGATWWCLDVSRNWPWFYTLATLLTMSQLINVIGGIIIVGMIKSMATRLTRETYKIYMQLSVVLLIQCCVPFVSIFIPITCMSLLVPDYQSLSIDEPLLPIQEYTKLLLLMVSLFPLINGLLNIIFIKPYRNFATRLARRVCCCCLKRMGDASPAAIAPNHATTTYNPGAVAEDQAQVSGQEHMMETRRQFVG